MKPVKWKEAATIILLKKNGNVIRKTNLMTFNYDMLLLERNKKSSFMPSAYVFPGGKIAGIDHSQSWRTLFEPNSLFFQTRKQLPPILQSNSINSSYKNLAFRVCGIREMFEETGLFLYQNSVFTKKIGDFKDWRNKIIENEEKFLEMCQTLELKPDITSLFEWSNWLTPTQMAHSSSNKRFDTIFYLTILKDSIYDIAIQDDREIVKCKWYCPLDVLKQHYEGTLWLAPPQLYEIHRLLNFQDIDKLKMFASEREEYGLERWLPVTIRCSDGALSVLPGDDLYPLDEEVDLYGSAEVKSLPCTVAESRSKSKQLHRFEFYSLHDSYIQCNIKLQYKHVQPLTDSSITQLR